MAEVYMNGNEDKKTEETRWDIETTEEKNRVLTMFNKSDEVIFRQEFNDITEVDLYELETEGRYEITDKKEGIILSGEAEYEMMMKISDELNIRDMNVEAQIPFSDNELYHIAEGVYHYGINENDLPYRENGITETEDRKEQINIIVSGLKSKDTNVIDKYEEQIIDAYLRIHGKFEKSNPENNAEYNELKEADRETDAAAVAVHRISEIEWSNMERGKFRNAAVQAGHKFLNIGDKEKENFIRKFESRNISGSLHKNHKEKMLYRMIKKGSNSKEGRQKEAETPEKQRQRNKMKQMQGRSR